MVQNQLTLLTPLLSPRITNHLTCQYISSDSLLVLALLYLLQHAIPTLILFQFWPIQVITLSYNNPSFLFVSIYIVFFLFAATSLNISHLRPLIPLLETMSQELNVGLNNILNLMTGAFYFEFRLPFLFPLFTYHLNYCRI